MKFIITVDTEADNEWQRLDKIKVENIKFLPRFQALCEKYEFKPTYLLTYDVASDKESVSILKPWQDSGQAEIGAHLHPWSNPPMTKERSWETKHHRFPHDLSEDELKSKMETLTNVIKDNFQIMPKSFRAGRWGFDKRVAKEITRLNYLVDCSITPKIDWTRTKGDPNGQGGKNFKHYQVAPYFLDIDNISKVGKNNLLEVPMTVLFTLLFKKEDTSLSNFFLGLPDSFFKKVINKLFFGQKWLRVFPNSKMKDWQRIYESAKKNNLPVMEFMIHSSELMPGGSPYAKDHQSVEFVYQQIEDLFKFLKKQGLQGRTLSEFYYDFK
ncbi:hypothetical protein HOB10_03280 [Candidatus Parcubacteria bacterium]|jgi:hypothetical protein|nr:hypothetical protein [Candidatus Parcubacteria bacterium]